MIVSFAVYMYVHMAVTPCFCMFAVVMVVEIAWLVVGVIWLVKYYHSCQAPTAKEALIGKLYSSLLLSITIH